MRRMLWMVFLVWCCAKAFAQPDTLWTWTWGGSGSQAINAGLQLDDGSFLVGTDTTITVISIPHDPWWYERRDWCILMVRTNLDGDTLWTRRYLPTDSSDVHASSVCQAWDGGYMIAGDIFPSDYTLRRDVYLAKADSAGNIIWEQHYGTERNEWCYSVHSSLDGGYILAGLRDSYPAGDEDSYIVKVDEIGTFVWERVHGVASEWWSEADVIISTPDGGYAYAGYFDYRGYMVKLSAEGDTLWTRFVPEAYEGGQIRCMMTTEDGGYIVGGMQMIVRVDSMGHTVWLRSLPSDFYNQYHEVWSMIQLPNGDILGVGREAVLDQNPSDFWIVRLTSDGEALWDRAYPAWGEDVARTVQRLSDGGYLLSGFAMEYPFTYRWDIRMIHTTPDGTPVDVMHTKLPSSFILSNFPNPFNSSTQVRFDLPRAGHVNLSVFDITGREVATLKDETMSAGSHSVDFDASSLPSGVYIYRLTTGTQSQARKMVLLK